MELTWNWQSPNCSVRREGVHFAAGHSSISCVKRIGRRARSKCVRNVSALMTVPDVRPKRWQPSPAMTPHGVRAGW
eukprot:8620337-Pyramimonas_sp.AAC.1